MSTAKYLCGALAGVAAGIAIGLLIAPDTGEETRKKIKKKAYMLRGRVKHVLGNGGDGLSELRDIFEHEATGIKDDLKDRIMRLLDKSSGVYNSFKREV
jgi:gas vesicle protein